MTVLVLIFSAAFLVAFLTGWLLYRAFVWHYVDLVYYPLAAVDVALLFISNDIQRELFEVTRAHNQQIKAFELLQSNKPNIEVLDTENLLSVGVESIALVKQWVDVCNGGPSGAEARCLAVDEFSPHVDTFLAVARGKFASYEDRLLATCNAGDELLQNIADSGGISALMADKLIDRYTKAVSLRLHPLEYDKIAEQIKKFRQEATQYIQKIHRLAFQTEDESSRRLLSIQLAQIEYGEMIFRGLEQCVTAPRKELDTLSNWKSNSSSQAEKIARLAKSREALRKNNMNHPDILWMQLNLWPFVLGLALSLKFAKGSAALRKARRDLPNK
jgi:hypothetical protein